MKLSVQHITKTFGERRVLNDISFDVSLGKVCVLMGTNGSGKTTLFNILTGFVGQDKGEVLLDGVCVNQLKPYERCRKGIGRTFQDLRLIGDLTVRENIMLAFPKQDGENWWNVLLLTSRVKTEQDKNRRVAETILKQCFIDDVADSKAGEISYGQQKLLNLACCMACGTPVLLLDDAAPHWSAEFIDNEHVDLSPSIWKIHGCKSHFFVKNNRVIWVQGKDMKISTIEKSELNLF